MQWPLEGRGLQLGRTFSLAIASSPVSPFLFPFFSPPSSPLSFFLPILYSLFPLLLLTTHTPLPLSLFSLVFLSFTIHSLPIPLSSSPSLSSPSPPPSISVCKSHFLFSASHSLQRHGGVECECCPISLWLKEGRECSGGHDVRNDDDYDDGEHDRL